MIQESFTTMTESFVNVQTLKVMTSFRQQACSSVKIFSWKV